jgi:hypothetical protein
MTVGTVFYFYCPFGGDRLARVMDALHSLAQVRPLRLCFVDMPVPDLPWLVEEPAPSEEPVAICRTRIKGRDACAGTPRARSATAGRRRPRRRSP